MFRVGVLYRVGDLMEFLSSSPLSKEEFLRDFQDWRGVSGSTALAVGYRGGWILSDSSDYLALSAEGRAILAHRDSGARLREQVRRLIQVLQPPWARLAARGRKAVETYAPPEAVQCLREAGLLTSKDGPTVEWWDEIATSFFAERTSRLVAVGRHGERLSLQYETERTGFEPEWVSINRADAGFDILSRVGREIADPLAIETKTSEVPWQDAFLYLTRHELTTLQAVLHSCLHLWSVHDEVPLIAVVPVVELRAHTPQDRGGGTWREVRIAFRALEQSPVEFRP